MGSGSIRRRGAGAESDADGSRTPSALPDIQTDRESPYHFTLQRLTQIEAESQRSERFLPLLVSKCVMRQFAAGRRA